MAPKGSRKNPYTWSEYTYKLYHNTWNGGWVKNGDELCYYSSSESTYSGKCAKSNPVPSDLYTEMAQLEIWLGGWVLFNTYNTSEKRYIGSHGTEYDITIGSQNNPCSFSLYDEMKSNGVWEGGWVELADGTIRYMQNFQISVGSGSGCGCGSGSGCGSGGGSGSGSDGGSGSGGSGSGEGSTSGEGTGSYPISAGNCVVGSIFINDLGETGDLYAGWTAGNTVGPDGLSVATITIRFSNNNYSVQENHIRTEWQGAYILSISGYFLISTNPGRYYFISGTCSIPGEYCIQ